MYSSYIGQKFLRLWNERTGRNLSAKEFFTEVQYPLFFKSERYLQWVPNSPFAQKVAAKNLTGNLTATEVQLQNLHAKAASGTTDASFVIGFPAEGTTGTTSGQVSGVGPVVNEEEIYCSWIGGGLGVGLSGGLSLLIDDAEILWKIYSGWQHYREHLNERTAMKGNQIDTWNGRWLTHTLGEHFNEKKPLQNFRFDDALTGKEGTLSIKTQPWVDVVFGLTSYFKGQPITPYVYALSQTNKTVGFIPFRLQEVAHLEDFYGQVFQDTDAIKSWEEIRNLYETHFSFPRVCEQGSIGLKALEPTRIIDSFSEKTEKGKAPSETETFQFHLYQLWLLAMLNNKELYGLADTLADALHHFSTNEEGANKGRGLRVRDQQINNLFTRSRLTFIEKLTDLLEKSPAKEPYVSVFEDVVQKIMAMPAENFPLFNTLVRFRYVTQQSKATA